MTSALLMQGRKRPSTTVSASLQTLSGIGRFSQLHFAVFQAEDSTWGTGGSEEQKIGLCVFALDGIIPTQYVATTFHPVRST